MYLFSKELCHRSALEEYTYKMIYITEINSQESEIVAQAYNSVSKIYSKK